MPIRIFSNISSINSQRHLGNSNSMVGKSLERISSGIRIRTAADDGAGLAITETLRADVQALKQASRNVNDGISLIQTAEGALNATAGMLIRLRELASQAATGTIVQRERDSIQLEYNALLTEIDRIADTTEFNGQKLIDGTLAADASDEIIIQTGVTTDITDRVNLNEQLDITSVTAAGLGLDNSNISSQQGALDSMDALQGAIQTLVDIRGRVGATQNELTRTSRTHAVNVENFTSAVSTIRETDVAEELAFLTRNQILVQSASSMIGQANLIPQSVLTLLQG